MKVIGISPDPVKKHQKFKQKYGYSYPLVSDEGHVISERYGVWVEKSLYGRKYWGVARTTFVIDGTGRIARVFEKVQPDGHAQEIAELLGGQEGRRTV